MSSNLSIFNIILVTCTSNCTGPTGMLSNQKNSSTPSGTGFAFLATTMSASPIFIPIASGKGGVGKSFLTGNLAIALAERGHRTIAVDLDLGGSNLHSFLGLPNRFPGIGDYIKTNGGEISDFLVSTDIPNLKFLVGDGKTPFMANITYAQKMKLISQLKSLSADYILLDQASGSAYNTLDFFGMTPVGMVVTTPEYPAVMNMMIFLKSALLRRMDRKMVRNHDIRKHLYEWSAKPIEEQVASVSVLQQHIAEEDEAAGKIVSDILNRFRPRIIINRGDHPDDLEMTDQISKNLSQILCVEADFFGFIFYDKQVGKSVQHRQPYLPNHRDKMTAKNIVRLSERIEKYWKYKVNDSAARLKAQAVKDYQSGLSGSVS